METRNPRQPRNRKAHDPPCIELRELQNEVQTLRNDITGMVATQAEIEKVTKGQDRILKLLDGDPSLGLTGIRDQLLKIREDTTKLSNERNRMIYILFGVGLGAGLLGSGFGKLILAMIGVIP